MISLQISRSGDVTEFVHPPHGRRSASRLLELTAEAGEIRDPEHVGQELLLTYRSLVRTGVDLTREVLTERSDARELALCDQAAQWSETAGVLRREYARGRPRRW